MSMSLNLVVLAYLSFSYLLPPLLGLGIILCGGGCPWPLPLGSLLTQPDAAETASDIAQMLLEEL